MKNNVKIVFFGNPKFALPALGSLMREKYQITGVITAPDKPVGRKHIITPPPVKVLAQKNGLTIYQPENKAELLKIMKNLQPDLAIVAAFGMIFPKEILSIPKYGFINIHPSILPRWRGPSPIQTAILNGDEKTGITLFLMDEEIDHGPIISNEKLVMSNEETTEILSKKLSELGADLLIETLPKFVAGEITPLPQNEAEVTYTKKFSTQDAYVEPKNLEEAQQKGGEIAEKIERKIRALNPEPGVWTLRQAQGKQKRIKILEAKLVEGKLKITQIQTEGKKPQKV